MEIKQIITERRTVNGEGVDSIRLTLSLTDEELAGLQIPQEHQGMTEVLEHYLTLYAPPVDVEQAVQEAVAVKGERLRLLAMVLPDDIALRNLDLYEAWAVGLDLEVGDRITHEGGLYRVQQAHTTQSDWVPGINTASLYTHIQPPDEIPDWVQGSWAKDVRIRHNGKVWLSMVDNNVYEPGAAGVYENIWKEVAA